MNNKNSPNSANVDDLDFLIPSSVGENSPNLDSEYLEKAKKNEFTKPAIDKNKNLEPKLSTKIEKTKDVSLNQILSKTESHKNLANLENTSQKNKNLWQRLWQFKKFRILTILLGVLSILTSLILGFVLIITPTNLAFPKMDHAHFRLQFVFLGQREDFGSPRYQVDYIKDVCSGALTESPIHFHDNLDQMVHLHWQKITGGQVLKFYGLNKIGGLDGSMGYKIDQSSKFQLPINIPIHNMGLPKGRSGDQFFVYTGDKNGFIKRKIEDFLWQDLETFLGQNSIIREQNAKQTFLESDKQNENYAKTAKLADSNSNSQKSFSNSKIRESGQVEKSINPKLDLNKIENWQKENSNSETKNSQKNQNLENSKITDFNNFWKNMGNVPVEAHVGQSHATLTESEQHEANEKIEIKEKAEINRKNNQVNSQNISSLDLQNSQSSVSQNLATNSGNSQISTKNSQNSNQNLQNSLSTNSSQKTEEELKKINNLLGNIVIFVQPNEPTTDQIQARFNKLVPLGESVCGG